MFSGPSSPGLCGLSIKSDEVRPEERRKAESLRVEFYGNPSWTRRR